MLASRIRLAALALLASAATACAHAGAIPTTGMSVDPGVEAAVVSATAPTRPRQIVFSWSMREGDARFSGKGVARVDAPYRGRLDLYGPRGEAYLQAVLIGDELRLPPGADAEQLPPASLLWTTLGVVRAPEGTTLVGATRDSTRTELVYAQGDDRWRFTLAGDRLQRAEHERPGSGRESVELEYRTGLAVPARSVYRDWTAFRELVLTADEVKDVEPFSPDVWTPGR